MYAISGQIKSTLYSTKLKAVLNVQQASTVQVDQRLKPQFHVQLVLSDLKLAQNPSLIAHPAETVARQTLPVQLNASFVEAVPTMMLITQHANVTALLELGK